MIDAKSLISSAFLFALPVTAAAQTVPVAVRATPIEQFDATGRTRIGAVEFRGGLVLTSPESQFGGLSGMALDATGEKLIALTDKGYWLSATLLSQDGRPTGLTDAQMAPLVAADGRKLASQGLGDSESLALTGQGTVVGIERRHEIWSFPGPDPLGAKGKQLISFKGIAELGSNEGIEALAIPPEGKPAALIAIAEQDPKDPAILPGFLFSPLDKPRLVGRFAIERIDEFSATDLSLGPDGKAYLLERRYDPLRGVAMRIRRFELTQLVDGAKLSGEVLMEAHRAAAIDNMEALAVTRDAGGEILLTVLSDDNFSPLQRTVLLRFALVQ
ncbi:esterase-like activity of phytase family protein [Ancylobacter sp. Lp-2]|uniref:esterase-like activity of phytase family protein n=1 Tax=Ancylobacter sp. Lp-2 TaxID=2881339 RepID=UPI001E51D972|nr:esterase-like activity of phytase family protein [Ancylobacter sp. Lp-2]MCB4767604.1 esterase-like activity of phytase family protein [Ancylobacter sp. Lp-2]